MPTNANGVTTADDAVTCASVYAARACACAAKAKEARDKAVDAQTDSQNAAHNAAASAQAAAQSAEKAATSGAEALATEERIHTKEQAILDEIATTVDAALDALSTQTSENLGSIEDAADTALQNIGTEVVKAETAAHSAQTCRDEACQCAEDAEVSATVAGTKASEAASSATAAQTSETNAARSAQNAEDAESRASGKAQEAASSATAAKASETAAQAAWEKVESLRAEASTLEPGAAATASYADGVLALGIPKGEKGEKGDKGNTGATGSQGIPGEKGEKGDPGQQLLTDSLTTEDSTVGASATAVKKLNSSKFDKKGGTVSGAATFGAGVFEKVVDVASNHVGFDVRKGNFFTKTVSSHSPFAFSDAPASGTAACFTLILTNGGSSVVTWPASVKWADGVPPDLTISGVDILTFFTVDGGVTWYGAQSIMGVV